MYVRFYRGFSVCPVLYRIERVFGFKMDLVCARFYLDLVFAFGFT